jgi:hypothetical protein
MTIYENKPGIFRDTSKIIEDYFEYRESNTDSNSKKESPLEAQEPLNDILKLKEL